VTKNGHQAGDFVLFGRYFVRDPGAGAAPVC
jgi:hypothetical protein